MSLLFVGRAFLRPLEFAVFCEGDDLIGGVEKGHQESGVSVHDAVFLKIIFEETAAGFAEDAPRADLPAVFHPLLGLKSGLAVEF